MKVDRRLRRGGKSTTWRGRGRLPGRSRAESASRVTIRVPMTRPTLSVQPRSVSGKEVAKLRRAGTLPAVVYGAGTESQNIAVDAREFEVLRRHAGRHAVVDLTLDGGKPLPVLMHVIQEHPVSRKTLHIDFLAVNMDEERNTDVPIQAIGESEAVDKLGGVLL